jgi:hypothetical protein
MSLSEGTEGKRRKRKQHCTNKDGNRIPKQDVAYKAYSKETWEDRGRDGIKNEAGTGLICALTKRKL